MKAVKKLASLGLVGLTICVGSINTLACTGFVAGKAVTSDGSILMGRTEDIGAAYNKNFIVVEATKYKADDYFEDLNGFKISQPKKAYKYTMVPDVKEHGDGVYGEAGMNEKGVAMTATVSASVNEAVEQNDPLVENGLREAAMLSVVLPRINSAKHGVEVLGEIITKYGATEGNIVMFADQDEAWYMEILSGHQWAAVKVPDDKYAVIPNSFMLGYIDLEDKENVMASTDIINLPKEKGFLKEKDGKFHLALTYGETLKEGNRSRAWAGQHLLSASQNTPYNSEVFELFVTPDKKVSLEDVMALQRYRNEGTVYDVNLPGNENIRPIGTETQAECHVFQMTTDLPKEVGGVMWLAMGNAEHSVYLPSYNLITDTYAAYKVQGEEYSKDSAYWSFRGLSALAETNRQGYGNSVRAFWDAYQADLITNQAKYNVALTTLYKKNNKKAAKYATEVSMGIQKEAIEKANNVYSQLMTKLANDKSQAPKKDFVVSTDTKAKVY
ncbi:C69 family dipeptidase [Cellulosilyticum ruminicola]|uniref:C69 family dipeptidase n=1 Tax=Cellulosilyticum ruminicola TaxID=425254 RepID=UPI0006D293B3|nr:C69 family dipeptidase [Cellulosilyticum ruminicola]